MAQAIKMVFLDLDGTLLNSRKELSPVNREALIRAAQNGTEIVPCTGRFLRALPESVAELPFIRYTVTMNGAMAAEGSRVLYRAEMKLEDTLGVLEYFSQYHAIYDCYQDQWGWMNREMQENADHFVNERPILEMIRKYRSPVENLMQTLWQRGRRAEKVQAFFSNPADRLQALRELPALFPQLDVTSSLPMNVEVGSRLAQKGMALLALCKDLRIAPAQTAAFGDGLNDISMLRAAGIGIAMGNASIEVRQMADWVTNTNDENGVAAGLDWLGLIGK